LPTPASPLTTTTVPRPARPTEASASLSTANWPARSSKLVRPAWYGGNDSSLGHAQCCTLLAAISNGGQISLRARNCPTMGK